MKQFICLVIFVLFFGGCGKEEINTSSNALSDEPQKPDFSEFRGYHVKDTVGFQKGTLLYYTTNDSTWIFGIKDEKVWFGLFDEETKKQQKEWKSVSDFSIEGEFRIVFRSILQSGECVFFIQKSELAYTPILLEKDEKALPFDEYEILTYGIGALFMVREIGNDILISYSESCGNLYSRDGKLVVNSIGISEKQDDNRFYLSGFKEDRTWFCVCLNDKIEQEYLGVEPYERNIKLHIGYGEYEDYYIKTLPFDDFWGRLIVTDWGYVYAPALGDRHVIKDIFLCKDGRMERMDAPLSHFTLHNWYKGTFLVYEFGGTVGSIIKYTIYSSDKEIVKKYSKISEVHVDPFRTGSILPVPVSYDEYIWNDKWDDDLRIRRYRLESSAINPVWQQTVGQVSENAIISWILLDNQSSVWLYQIDVLNYDGSKQQIKFSVDIESGNVKKL